MSRLPFFQFPGTTLVAAVSLSLAGCAAFKPPAVPPFRNIALSMTSAQALVIPGSSTRSNVTEALGPATVVVFDSGFEVWAYREKRPQASTSGTELVILFAPSGIVKKTRLRLPSVPPAL